MWDVFICHAWEDKETIARPLAETLINMGLKVWYDEFTMKLGDSLRRSIDRGLLQSRYGIVILSPDFFVKEWPQRELDGLLAREASSGGTDEEKVILPIWHNVTQKDVEGFSPILADKLGVSTANGLEIVVKEILSVVRPMDIPVFKVIEKKNHMTEKEHFEEIGEELLKEVNVLIKSDKFDPEGYNKVVRNFQDVADSISEDLQLQVRGRIRNCYDKMRKNELEELEKKVKIKRFPWNSFISRLEQLRADLEGASPGEFFRLYDTYDQSLDFLEQIDLSDVPTFQIEKAKQLLDECYHLLKYLRAHA